ncbi:MAG: type IV pilus modification protein PilV [Candidatus Rariloculaceae bacterium]
MSEPKQKQQGFTLVESMVSLVVLSVGMIGIAALYAQGLGAGRSALYRTQAVNLVADMADRIRANRRAIAAYAGPANNNGCDPMGGGVDCTPTEMAAHDLFLWDQQVRQALPNGDWQVQVNGGTLPPSYTIQVTWDEVGQGQITHQTLIQVPQT